MKPHKYFLICNLNFVSFRLKKHVKFHRHCNTIPMVKSNLIFFYIEERLISLSYKSNCFIKSISRFEVSQKRWIMLNKLRNSLSIRWMRFVFPGSIDRIICLPFLKTIFWNMNHEDIVNEVSTCCLHLMISGGARSIQCRAFVNARSVFGTVRGCRNEGLMWLWSAVLVFTPSGELFQ